MITVTLENFQTAVVAGSQSSTMVIDFHSPRAPQCEALSATLQTLETEYGGAFTLAQVNADTQAQIAQAFQIQSVPTVIVFQNGQPVDGFSGAMPEAEIRTVLNKHVQAIAKPADDTPPELAHLAAAQAALTVNDATTAITELHAALAANPAFDAARLLLVQQLAMTDPDTARATLAQVAISTLDAAQTAQHTILDAQLNAASRAAQSPEILALNDTLAANPQDLTTRLALCHALRDVAAFEPALEHALAIVKQDRTFNDDAGRKAMLELFGLASGAPELVRAWRQKLSAALN